MDYRRTFTGIDDCQVLEEFAINTDCLEFLLELTRYNQVVLLIDYPSLNQTQWICDRLTKVVGLQFDAIYALPGEFKHCEFLIDLSQILNDFGLFTVF